MHGWGHPPSVTCPGAPRQGVWSGARTVVVVSSSRRRPRFLPFILTGAVIGFVIGAFLIYYAYFAMFEALWNGQTPGKRALGLRVVAGDGAPVGWLASFTRNLMRTVDMLPVGYGFGLASTLVDRWGRRLGDLVARTLVVHVARPRPGR